MVGKGIVRFSAKTWVNFSNCAGYFDAILFWIPKSSKMFRNECSI